MLGNSQMNSLISKPSPQLYLLISRINRAVPT